MGKVYDAMGNYTGVDDPATDVEKPSPDLAKPADGSVPDPKGGPIVVAGQIKLGKWTIYADGEKLYAKTASGKKVQFELFDPLGVTQTQKPNKVSDGSDGSTGESVGNTATTGRTVPGSGASSSAAGSTTTPGSNASDTTPQSAATPAGFNKTNFTATDQSGRAAAEKYLGRAMTDDEWNNLVAATYAEAGSDPQEEAWIMGTILNRTRQTGGTVMDVLNQQNQFTSVTGTPVNPNPSTNFAGGPPVANENNINNAANNYLSNVPQNNYYFNAADRNAVQQGESYVTQRAGVQGVLVGQSFVYPGAKWP